MIHQTRSYVFSILYTVGLASIYIGERVMGTGTARTVLTVLGLAVVAAAIGARVVRLNNATAQRRRIERWLLILTAIGVLGLLLYFLQSDVFTRAAGGKGLDVSAPKLAGVLAALYPALLAASVIPLLMAEMSYAGMANAPIVEGARVADAALSGLATTFAIIFAFAVVYVGSERDVTADFSYFRTAKPGESTRKIVQGLADPIDVYLFYPPANDVAEQVKGYFRELAAGGRLNIHEHDQAVDMAKARELGVSGNGAIVLAKGQRREQLLISEKMDQARVKLKTLDQEVQKKLLPLARTRRVVYFTVGHGEREMSPSMAGPMPDQRPPVGILKEILTSQNHDVRVLGPGEGLANQIPEDAAAVFILGPTVKFAPEEVRALSKYFDGGGRLLIALDPEVGADYAELLGPLGVKFTPQTLANDERGGYIVNRNHPSDRRLLVVTSFSSHPSVTTLSQLQSRGAIVLAGAGYIESLPNPSAGTLVDFIIHGRPTTWNDIDGDFEHDHPIELRKAYELAAAIVRKKPTSTKPEEEGRAVVLGDMDVVSDLTLVFPGNQHLALDLSRWLLGEESISGAVNTEQDVPVQHTRKENTFWFYSTVFLAPAAVLGLGFVLTRQRRRARRAAKAERTSGGTA